MGIPYIIKKNTLMFTLAQAMNSAGSVYLVTATPLLMLRYTNNLALAGAVRSIEEACRLIMSYPAGKLMDNLGRKPVIVMGWTIMAMASVVIFLSTVFASFPVFLAGILMAGLGSGVTLLTRIVGADMYPPRRRAEGVGYVVTGSAIGSFAGPVIVAWATVQSLAMGLDEYALPFLTSPVFLLTSTILIWTMVRPDPREIARHLSDYYPELKSARQGADPNPPAKPRGFGALLSDRRITAAVMMYATTYGNMAMMMALISVVMKFKGIPISAITLGISFHILGMFGFSAPIGRLSDRLGHRNLLIAGGVISAISGVTSVIGEDYITMTASIFAVGLGWCAANVSSTAIIGRATTPIERGKAMGGANFCAHGLNMILPIAGGWILQSYGFGAVGIFVVILAIPAIVVCAAYKEPPRVERIEERASTARQA